MAKATLSKHGALTVAGRIYSLINKEFYSGNLPKCTFKIELIVDAWGEAYHNGINDDGKPLIRITPYMARYVDLLTQVLIHEIVHIAKPDLDHGDRFEQEMVNIRKKCLSRQLW